MDQNLFKLLKIRFTSSPGEGQMCVFGDHRPGFLRGYAISQGPWESPSTCAPPTQGACWCPIVDEAV